jgi:hypothetical protein
MAILTTTKASQTNSLGRRDLRIIAWRLRSGVQQISQTYREVLSYPENH